MKRRIETALSPLLGLPLTSCWRPGVEGFEAVQRFEFGLQRPATDRSLDVTFGLYALHVGCPWRIIGEQGIVAAYIDLYFPAENPTESGGDDDFDCYAPGANRRDVQVEWFAGYLGEANIVVESIEVDEVGSVYMRLSGGYRLEILPMDSLHFEYWRLLGTDSMSEKQPHFVVKGRGVRERCQGMVTAEIG